VTISEKVFNATVMNVYFQDFPIGTIDPAAHSCFSIAAVQYAHHGNYETQRKVFWLSFVPKTSKRFEGQHGAIGLPDL
jgi:hypothetical protein